MAILKNSYLHAPAAPPIGPLERGLLHATVLALSFAVVLARLAG